MLNCLDLERAVYVLKVGSAREGIKLNFGGRSWQRPDPRPVTCGKIDCEKVYQAAAAV